MEEESKCESCGTLSKITNQRFNDYEEKLENIKELWKNKPNNWVEQMYKELGIGSKQ